jgi:hypothetical protein
VFIEKPAGNFKEFTVSRDLLYASVTRVLCSRNFLIENEDKEKGFLLGKRSFQRGHKTIVLLVQAKLVADSPDRSSIFVNALETTESYYVSDRTRFFLFLVPLPGGGGKQASSVKEAEKSVQDPRFYKDFFGEVEKELSMMSVKQVPAAAVVIPVATVQVPEIAPVVDVSKTKEAPKTTEAPKTVEVPQSPAVVTEPTGNQTQSDPK